MKRSASDFLESWLATPTRQPLIIRGARQVGKTWLVRELARRSARELVELNFERDPGHARCFGSGSAEQMVDELALLLSCDILTEHSLLFLDEIQAAPQVIPKLRWFAEQLPALPVIAAGSLLEFVLADHAFSMPVGRVGYCHLEPMGFPEYLEAHGQHRVLKRLESWDVGTSLSPALHQRATELFERYAMVGGLPAVVAADASGADPLVCRRLQRDLVATYRDDFGRYTGRMDPMLLDGVLLACVAQLGAKFTYARAGEGLKQHQAKRAVELLAWARLCHFVECTAADGPPLAGQLKPRYRRCILLDIGLVHALLGTPAGKVFPRASELAPPIRGQLAEQMLGQQLRGLRSDLSEEPRLFYWQRIGGGAAELDYLLQWGHRVVPIELKSGAAGAMKSLHQFMHSKRLPWAVRVDANPPSLQPMDVKTSRSHRVRYQLLNLPHYLVFRLGSLLDSGLAAASGHIGPE